MRKTIKNRNIWALLLLLNLVAGLELSALSLPYFFADNMVLQQLQPIRVWGLAAPFERVEVRLHQRDGVARADAAGHWAVDLAPLPAGGPYVLSVAGETETVSFQNVMMGEVWICAGQSNMEWKLWRTENGDQEVANADYPNIRLFKVPKTMAASPQSDLSGGQWEVCTPESTRDFSGLGYFFGRGLHQDLGVAIGLIEVVWGGTRISSWMSPQSLADDPNFSAAVAELDDLDIPALEANILQAQADWDAQVDDVDIGLQQNWQQDNFNWGAWPTMDVPRTWESAGLQDVDGVVWFKRAFQLTAGQAQNNITLSLSKVDDSDQTYVNGQLVGETLLDPGQERLYTIPAAVLQPGQNVITVRVTDYGYVGGLIGGNQPMRLTQGGWSSPLSGPWHYQRGTPDLGPRPLPLSPNDYPSLIYNSMVHPLHKLGMKGTIWYQGESDISDPYYYRDYFASLIDTWRTSWGRGEFPFLFVQLANFRPPATMPGQSGWATLRESQALALSRPRTAMAVAIDVGEANDIHPKNKQTVGYRLNLAAKGLAYTEQGLRYSSPRWRSATAANGEMLLTFDEVGTGLQSLHGQANLRGFAIAGADGQFVWADAEIRGPDQVAVFSPQVPAPVFVRYAWSDNPGTLDLYNSEGLPAAPFRTDTLPVVWQ